MSLETQINNVHNELKHEILNNEDNSDSIAFLNHLLYTKHEQNATTLRKQILTQVKKQDRSQVKQLLSNYDDEITTQLFNNSVILGDTKQRFEKSKNRRLSVDLHNVEVPTESIDSTKSEDSDEDANLTQLRKRLLKGHDREKQASTLTYDEQLNNEESRQEDILKDMFQFIQGIKEGANAFNEKMNQDSNVLSAAGAGLEVTSNKLMKSSNNLSKTISQLGLFDSLKLFALILGLFFLSLIIIQIFPKW